MILNLKLLVVFVMRFVSWRMRNWVCWLISRSCLLWGGVMKGSLVCVRYVMVRVRRCGWEVCGCGECVLNGVFDYISFYVD